MRPRGIGSLIILVVLVALAGGAGTARAVALRWSGPRLVDHAAPFGDPVRIASVSCPTATFCLGVGNFGTVVTAVGESPPKVVDSGIDGSASLASVSCPTTSFCVAVPWTVVRGTQLFRPNGSVLTTTDPTARKPVWRATSAPPRLDSVGCPTASLCLGLADRRADSLLSANPAGGASAWQPAFDASSVGSFACAPGGGLCVAPALDDTGDPLFATTTDPAGGPSAWTITPGGPGLVSLTCPSVALCVGFGQGQVLTSASPAAAGASWTVRRIPITSGGNLGIPVGVGCGSPSLASCIVAMPDGSVIVGGGSATAPTWTRSAVLDPHGFGSPGMDGANSVGCQPGATPNCLVSDQAGALVRVVAPGGSVAPTATATSAGGLTEVTGLSCPAVSLCVGVDNAGGVLSTRHPAGPASGWRRRVQPTAAAGLNAISCPSMSFCAAAGNDGRVLTSTSPGSGTWRSTKLPFAFPSNPSIPVDLEGIACPSRSLCVTTGSDTGQGNLFVSTHPNAGPNGWQELGPDYRTFDSLACASTTLCIAGGAAGELAVSTAPTQSWKLDQLRTYPNQPPGLAPPITVVACARTKLCLAGAHDGHLFASKNPAGGGPTFTNIKLSRKPIASLACRSAKLCTATDGTGRVWTSTNPTGPVSAWHAQTLDPDSRPLGLGHPTGLTALACAPSAICVAGDGVGHVFSSR